MELILKAAASALLTAAVGLLLKKQNPEIALLLGAVTALGILFASLKIVDGLGELRQLARQMIGSETDVLLAPILKCLAISVVTRFSADSCRDASQSAAASAIEFAGSACSLTAVMPLLLSVLKTVGGFL